VKAANGNIEVRVPQDMLRDVNLETRMVGWRDRRREHMCGFDVNSVVPNWQRAESESSTKTPESNSSSGPNQTPRSTSEFVRSHIVVKAIDHVSLKAQKIRARSETSKVW
jgi:hypothetical protein